MRETIASVGIDIGTSTTHLVFSKITIENLGGVASVPRIQIVDKRVVHRSDIYITPLVSADLIDGDCVRDIVASEYLRAAIEPRDISAGAVIITGETARKENARVVLEKLSDYAGNFVVATAGSDLEGIIAGRGAGTSAMSKEERSSIANFDIGGGTTNIAIFAKGEVADTSCLDIGGRLVRIDPESRRVEYLSPKIKRLVSSMGIEMAEGRIAGMDSLRALASRMAGFLDEIAGLSPESDMLETFITSRRFRGRHKLDGVTFSGGVADFVYSDGEPARPFEYGDIGVILGKAVKETKLHRSVKVRKPAETIRATVVGAGIHIVNISGSTITYTRDVFPLRDIPVLKASPEDEENLCSALGEGIAEKLKWFRQDSGYQNVAIGMRGVRSPSFDAIGKIADQILAGVSDALPRWPRLVVIVEEDMAKALGHALARRLGDAADVVSIDGVKVENGDYVDIGSPLGQGRVVPVAVKTLIFGA
jgi:ethanolamine utilization protein EutA